MSSELKIGDELDCGYVFTKRPVVRFTVRRAAESAFEVLRVTMDLSKTPMENEKRVTTYGNQEDAEDHARTLYTRENQEQSG